MRKETGLCRLYVLILHTALKHAKDGMARSNHLRKKLFSIQTLSLHVNQVDGFGKNNTVQLTCGLSNIIEKLQTSKLFFSVPPIVRRSKRQYIS